jgi:hypothetical protein
MSIIAHLRQVSAQQIREFQENPSTAYSFILGKSLSSAKTLSQELQNWKARNALTLLKVIQAGKLENLDPQDRQLFDQAGLEFDNISRNAILQSVASTPRAPRPEPDLSLEKSWQGIHYVLTGLAEGGRAPLSWAVLGDKEIPDTERLLGYGPARFLKTKQVSSVSKVLLRFTKEKFRWQFKPAEMKAAKVYGVKGGEDLEYLWTYFQKVKTYYSQATKQHNGMLCYFD